MNKRMFKIVAVFPLQNKIEVLDLSTLKVYAYKLNHEQSVKKTFKYGQKLELTIDKGL